MPPQAPGPQRTASTADEDLTSIPEQPATGTVFTPISTDAPLAPDSLTFASESNRARWVNRTLLEFILLMAALLLPQIAAVAFGLSLPFASLMSGVFVAITVTWAAPHARLGFRRADPGHLLEAMLTAPLLVVIATFYAHMLEQIAPGVDSSLDAITDTLSLPESLFVIAVMPALLEEIIFRGMLQGRLMALMGRRVGYLLTAFAFALVHGQAVVLPIHFGLGLYLGWLQQRSNSLWPCILMHFLYNGTLVTMIYLQQPS